MSLHSEEVDELRIRELADKIEETVYNSIERLSKNPEAVVVPSFILGYHLQMCAKEHPEYIDGVKKQLIPFF